MKRSRLFVSLILVLASPPVLGSEKPWLEARSAHFRVLTNGSNGDARKVLREFEELRWVFASRFGNARLESGAPLIIFATRDEPTAKALDPIMWKRMGEGLAGAFHHGWQKQYALVRLDTFGGEGAREVVYHEYTHSVLHLNAQWLPLWLDEGTAEFYAYSRFEDRRIFLGAPTERSKTLRSKTPLPVETLISMRTVPADESLFYAESWALLHYLIYGPGMENGKRFDEFFNLLQKGTSQSKALHDVFGEYKAIDKGLAAYMLQPTFVTTVLKDPPQVDAKAITFRTMTAAETEAELAGFHLWIHDTTTARTLTEQALKDDPKLGLAHENMGFLHFRDGKDAEAASEFKQAYSLDKQLYLSLFAGTMLSPVASSNSVDDMNALGATMGEVLQKNPQFAQAYVQLARLAVRENDLDSAIRLSRTAEKCEPSLAGYHLLTGQILQRAGKSVDAAESARFVAERWIGPDHNEAVELWNSVPAMQRTAGAALVAITPEDTLVVEGKVKSLTCAEGDQKWVLTLDHGSQTLIFHSKGPFTTGFSDTIWYGGDHFNLCRHWEGLRAIVHYRAPSDLNYAGDVAEIELRDDLPQPVAETTAAGKR